MVGVLGSGCRMVGVLGYGCRMAGILRYGCSMVGVLGNGWGMVRQMGVGYAMVEKVVVVACETETGYSLMGKGSLMVEEVRGGWKLWHGGVGKRGQSGIGCGLVLKWGDCTMVEEGGKIM